MKDFSTFGMQKNISNLVTWTNIKVKIRHNHLAASTISSITSGTQLDTSESSPLLIQKLTRVQRDTYFLGNKPGYPSAGPTHLNFQYVSHISTHYSPRLLSCGCGQVPQFCWRLRAIIYPILHAPSCCVTALCNARSVTLPRSSHTLPLLHPFGSPAN